MEFGSSKRSKRGFESEMPGVKLKIKSGDIRNRTLLLNLLKSFLFSLKNIIYLYFSYI